MFDYVGVEHCALDFDHSSTRFKTFVLIVQA